MSKNKTILTGLIIGGVVGMVSAVLNHKSNTGDLMQISDFSKSSKSDPAKEMTVSNRIILDPGKPS